MTVDYIRIGERIRYIRVQKGLSQEELAQFSDISPVYISNIERGTKFPSLKVIISIANALKISTDSLLMDSLTAADKPGTSDIFSLLWDCTKEENDILVKSMTQLKGILRNYNITE